MIELESVKETVGLWVVWGKKKVCCCWGFILFYFFLMFRKIFSPLFSKRNISDSYG